MGLSVKLHREKKQSIVRNQNVFEHPTFRHHCKAGTLPTTGDCKTCVLHGQVPHIDVSVLPAPYKMAMPSLKEHLSVFDQAGSSLLYPWLMAVVPGDGRGMTQTQYFVVAAIDMYNFQNITRYIYIYIISEPRCSSMMV